MARGDYYKGVDKNSRNAFAPSAPRTQSTVGNFNMGDLLPSFGGGASSRTYSPLTDPDGPLARAGWIGALLATGPSKSEYLRQQGAGDYQSAVRYMQDNAPKVGAQRAILNFIQSPEGNRFLANGGDPAELGKMASLATSEQRAQQRHAAFQGRGGSMGGQAPTVQQPPVQGGDPFAGMRAPGEQPPAAATDNVVSGPATTAPMVGQPQGPAFAANQYGAEDYLNIARELADKGDDEGAKAALSMAEQARLIEQMNVPPTTDDIKEYNLAVEQAKAAGEDPPSWMEYITTTKKAAATQNNIINNPEALAAAQAKARMEIDVDTAKKAGENAIKAAQAMPLLEEALYASQKAPGGYAGVIAPYLSRIAAAMNFQVPEGWSEAEKLYSVSMQLMPLVRQPGQTSNYEQVAYMRALPSLAQSPEARIKIIGMMQKQIQRAADVARIYRENVGSSDLYTKLAELDAKPMFNKEEQMLIDSANDQMDKQESINAVKVKTIKEADALPPGTTFEDPDGVLRQVPPMNATGRAEAGLNEQAGPMGGSASATATFKNEAGAAGRTIGGMVPQVQQPNILDTITNGDIGGFRGGVQDFERRTGQKAKNGFRRAR